MLILTLVLLEHRPVEVMGPHFAATPQQIVATALAERSLRSSSLRASSSQHTGSLRLGQSEQLLPLSLRTSERSLRNSERSVSYRLPSPDEREEMHWQRAMVMMMRREEEEEAMLLRRREEEEDARRAGSRWSRREKEEQLLEELRQHTALYGTAALEAGVGRSQ
eukprot:3528204-Rhodomonas_salina.1